MFWWLTFDTQNPYCSTKNKQKKKLKKFQIVTFEGQYATSTQFQQEYTSTKLGD